MCPTQVIILVLFILIIYGLATSKKEAMTGPAVGTKSYVRFYNDFDQKDKVFEMEGTPSGEPRYFKYIWRGDVKSIDINLLRSGPDGTDATGPRRARVWAYMFYSAVGTTLSDFYNIYQIPEHDYKAHPNLQLVADIKPGQRFQTDNVPFAKRFLVELVL
jgi:hypothetical protein